MVSAAVKQHIKTNKYAPKPADIRELLYLAIVPEESPAEEAWDIARHCWKYELSPDGQITDGDLKAYEKLPGKVKQILTLADMKSFARSSSDQIVSYEKPRFIKRYNELKEQQKAQAISSSKPMTEIGLDLKALEGKG